MRGVLEHHGELAQRLLRHARLVARLDLLLEVVLQAQRELLQLVPLLREAHVAVLRVSVVEDEPPFEHRSEVLDLFQTRLHVEHVDGALAQCLQLLLERAARLEQSGTRALQPREELVGELRELLPQRVVLLLARLLAQQLLVAVADDLLQVVPRLLQRVHREPRVRVRAHVEALNPRIEFRQLVELALRRPQRLLELLVSLA